MKAVFYPGCTLETAAGYEESIKAVNKVLGIDLPELDDWNCCGATALFSVDKLLSLVFPARNLAKAEKEEAKWIVTPCNACYATLRKVKAILRENEALREKVNKALSAEGLFYRGSISIKHLLDFYLQSELFEGIKERIKKPLNGLRVATYYGCQYTRPITGEETDDPEVPNNLDRLLVALGAEVVDYSMKTYCCGAAQMVSHEKGCLKLINRIVRGAIKEGADVIVAICPMCQFNVELGESKLGYRVPVLYFTQLIGLSLGIPKKMLGLEKLMISSNPLLSKI
ncbi:MAG: CoB--CoM heterodisulfide reductase iron-sulfur subunit B family protein [Caldimicrobium sp.]|jgi:heterodisulfide reductase subunit B